MRRRLTMVLSLMAIALLAVAPGVQAQATTGRISGIVKDTSSAVLPGVSVTVTETRTGFTRTEATDAQGAFIFVSLPLGDYTVGAELQGFKKASKSGFVLGADGRLTADFSLEVGQFSETVQVTIASETVNTVSGEVARIVDRAQVQDLALNGRNYLQLANLIPGAPIMNYNALDIMTGLGISTSINGSRQNANSLTVDGGFNMDSGSNNSQISNVGVDFIEEVNIKTANFSAEYGRNSGASINVVTRSGSNTFKGSAFEYLRRDKFDANDWFANLKGVKKAPLKYDNYGFSIGGPALKDKLFFFGGVEWKTIRRYTAPTFRTLPNSAMRGGDFSALTSTLKFPGTSTVIPGNNISSMITVDGRALANVYAAMAAQAVSYTDTPTANNALFQDANPFDFRQENVRVDFQPSGSHRLTGRMLLDHYSLIEPGGTFISSQLPTVPTHRMRPGRNIQANHYWTLKGNIVNEAKFNYSANGQTIPPVGDTWKRDSYGFQFAQVYQGGGRFENSIPDVNISGYASFRGAAQSLISPTWDYAFSDNLTWIKGAHTVKGGFLIVRNGKDQNGRSPYAGVLTFQTSSNATVTTGNAFADALLGNFYNYNEAQLDPMGYFRFWQREAFVSDAWRVSQHLSIEAGLRYTWQMPTSTLGNNTTSFDPALYNPAQAVTLNTNGTIVAGSGNRYNGLARPGAVPSDQTANVPNANSPLVQAIPFATNAGYYKTANLFAPRVSFAWTPLGNNRTVVRGGAGLFYDRPEGNLYFSLVNNTPFSLSSSYQSGNLGNIQAGTVPPITPWASTDSLSPDLAIPRVWNYSVGVQRELPWWGLFAEVSYVGATGQHQIRQPDINYPTFADLSANAVGLKASIDYLRPYKGFTAIRMRLSDASSQYHSLQVFLSKRRGDVNFTGSYTLSKSMDNGSGNGDNAEFNDLNYNYGPSDHDRRHVFVGTWTYRIPFLRNSRTVQGYVLGGWEISGIARFQTGAPLTVTGTQVIGRRADYLGGDMYVAGAPVVDAATGVVSYVNPAAFAIAPADRLGNSTRGMVRGPSYSNLDLSLRKQIPIKRTVRAQFYADFFNVFNQVNYQNPGVNLSSAGFGLITSAAPSRNVQLGLRVSF